MAFYQYHYRIGVTDIDRQAKITNKAILKIFQDIAGMHSESVHLGINDIALTKLSWVILNWKIQVLKRPQYNEEILVTTWIRNTNKITLYRDFEMKNQLGEIVAIGTSKWTLIHIDTKTLMKIPQEAIQAYGEENKKVFNENTIEKLEKPKEYDSQIEYKILRRDIDINEHVHNLYYLDMAYEALPEHTYYQASFNQVEIYYKLQIKPEDKVTCLYAKKNNAHIVTITSNQEKTLHAIIKLLEN